LKNWDKEQGDHLKHLLKQHRPGKSIRSIASEAGINHSNLSRALRGELSPSENMLKSLAFIGIPVPVKDRELTADMAWLNFESVNCPAWQFTLSKIIHIYETDEHSADNNSTDKKDTIADENNCSYKKLVESITIFFTLAELISPAIVSGFMFSLMNFNKEQLYQWLTSRADKDAMAKRLLFHATLYAIDPLAYVIEGGLLQIDQAVHFDKPDICISTPKRTNTNGIRNFLFIK
jgi:transcriptional regulator with XRE-family HTH domain